MDLRLGIQDVEGKKVVIRLTPVDHGVSQDEESRACSIFQPVCFPLKRGTLLEALSQVIGLVSEVAQGAEKPVFTG
jgi:hypothetical protein